jgi:hypothetical protein
MTAAATRAATTTTSGEHAPGRAHNNMRQPRTAIKALRPLRGRPFGPSLDSGPRPTPPKISPGHPKERVETGIDSPDSFRDDPTDQPKKAAATKGTGEIRGISSGLAAAVLLGSSAGLETLLAQQS